MAGDPSAWSYRVFTVRCDVIAHRLRPQHTEDGGEGDRVLGQPVGRIDQQTDREELRPLVDEVDDPRRN